ncbi:TetR/AcrR family transcriptional regulator [Microterricola viridarii]|uniref:DNA-binding transcriptional regulator, AcrR family n=1 Tax=Microterricola viridarii TaxID=412690 RepID=A0A1H1T6A7_9MICO|nr:TetR/AcrR family transcriptional regulator [Microterricola viridarii]SDS55747.1 DNA-binding transcriptional regulator, AcrR family [Microterricola viridarii]
MNTTKRQPRQRPETIARRQEILRAALDVFGSKGYANGTLIDIAEHVEMTHAGILHHFGSKNQLLLEVLKYRDESDVEDLEEQHIPDGIEFFRHLIRTASANARRAGVVQAYAVLSAESVTDGNPAREYFEQRYETLRDEAVHAFQVMCAERGVETPAAIAHASASIMAVMDGLQVQWLLTPDEVDLAKASEFAIEAIVSAVLDPRPPVLGEHAD